jgi:hypothetical protein
MKMLGGDGKSLRVVSDSFPELLGQQNAFSGT